MVFLLSESLIASVSRCILFCGSRFLATERQGPGEEVGFWFRLVTTPVASLVENTLLVSSLAITTLSQFVAQPDHTPWVCLHVMSHL